MEGFDTRRQGYDPKYRPYRIAIYVLFCTAVVGTASSVTWAVVSYLFVD